MIETKQTISFIIHDRPDFHHSKDEWRKFESFNIELSYNDGVSDIHQEIVAYVYSSENCFSIKDYEYLEWKQYKDKTFYKLLKNNCEPDAGDMIDRGTYYQAFCENLLCTAGLDVSMLRSAYDKLKSYHEELLQYGDEDSEEDLDEDDLKKKDLIMKKVQDVTTDVYEKLLHVDETTVSQKNYAEIVEKDLSSEIYQKLQKDSRRSLVTAMALFDYMRAKKDMDFSPVCLAVSKAVEVEVAKHFFTDYIKYCKETGVTNSEYFTKKQPESCIRESDFTLGDALFVAGYSFSTGSGPRTLVAKRSSKQYKQFEKYSKSKLYADRIRAEKFLKDDLVAIDKIRKDFRNPSAHREPMAINDAELCIKYVISVEKKL